MGCETVNVIGGDDNDQNYILPPSKNIAIQQYTGLLSEESDFKDTIIKSMDELNENLRTYIPLKIKKPESEEEIFNTRDDILTKAVEFDFVQNYILAITGIHKIKRVEEIGGNYHIFHDGIPPDKKSYIALVVPKKGIEPEIIFNPPKMIN